MTLTTWHASARPCMPRKSLKLECEKLQNPTSVKLSHCTVRFVTYLLWRCCAYTCAGSEFNGSTIPDWRTVLIVVSVLCWSKEERLCMLEEISTRCWPGYISIISCLHIVIILYLPFMKYTCIQCSILWTYWDSELAETRNHELWLSGMAL